MSFLQKRGKTWYARFNKIVDGQRREIKFSLKTRQRPVAVKRLEELQTKFERKEIDPFAPSFDLESALRENEENPEPWTLDDSLEMLLDSKRHRKLRTRQIYLDIVGYFLSFNNLNENQSTP